MQSQILHLHNSMDEEETVYFTSIDEDDKVVEGKFCFIEDQGGEGTEEEILEQRLTNRPKSWYEENQEFYYEGRKITVNACKGGPLIVTDGVSTGQFDTILPQEYKHHRSNLFKEGNFIMIESQ